MPSAKNQPDDIKIRKYRDTLVTGGLALITFGVWTIIRFVLDASNEMGNLMNLMTYKGLPEEETRQLEEMLADKSLLYGILGVVIVIMIIDLALRIYVGFSARAEGLQKRTKNGKERNGTVWLIFGFLLAAIGIYSLVSTLMETSVILTVYSVPVYVIQVFVEVTSLFIIAELVITGVRLRILLKKQQGSEEVRDAA